MGVRRQARTSLMAERFLRRRLGLGKSSKLIWRLKKLERSGEPWKELEPPASDDERDCRQEAGSVILLYDLLTELIGRDEALELLTEIVSEGGVLKLRESVPRLERARFDTMAPDEQKRFLKDIMGQFPNAEVGEVELTKSTFRYEITGCKFVDLTRRAGRPELAPLFCSGDGVYFDRHLPEVAFERTQTLAEGGTCCDFRFRWK